MPDWLQKILEALGASMLALFAPIHTMLLSTAGLVMADLIAGLLVARKRGEVITSRGLKRTVAKMTVYQVAIVLAYITETHLTQHSIPVLNVVTSIIGITEFKSVIENLHVLSGGDVFSSIVRGISKPTAEGSDDPPPTDKRPPSA